MAGSLHDYFCHREVRNVDKKKGNQPKERNFLSPQQLETLTINYMRKKSIVLN
jgi:hypothetical protein